MTAEKLLILLLRLLAVVLLSALFAVVMPFSWMNEIHRLLGMGELPDQPIMNYLTRSLSAMYAMHGALIFFVSLNLRRYLPLVKFLLIAALGFGAVMLGIDLHAGMPASWTISEGPYLIAMSSALLWLAARVAPNSAS